MDEIEPRCKYACDPNEHLTGGHQIFIGSVLQLQLCEIGEQQLFQLLILFWLAVISALNILIVVIFWQWFDSGF